MSTVAEELRVASIGIALALYPTDASLPMQIERAPDSSGSPDTVNAVTLALAPAGSRTFVDLAPSGPLWHYRSRHVSPAGFGSTNWTRWHSARAKRLPSVLPNVPDIAALDKWTTDIVFSPDSTDGAAAAEWTAGSLVVGNGTTYAISAGSSATYGADVIFYLYFDPAVSVTELQDTQTFTDLIGDGVIWLATCQVTADAATGSASVLPVQGLPSINARHINALTLSAIIGRLGTIIAGLIQNAETSPTAGIRVDSGTTLPATLERYIDLAATGSEPFLNHPLFKLRADGTFSLGGSFDNLVPNPGFELSATDIVGWQHLSGGGTWSMTTTSPRSGSRAVNFDPSGQTAESHLIAPGSGTSGWAVSGGDEIYAECYVRKVGAGTPNDCSIQIRFYDASGTFVSASTVDGILSASLTTSYQKMSGTATAPTTASYATASLSVENDGQTELVRFDDVYVRRAIDGTLLVGTVIADELNAATGTFTGSLTAATGEFTGTLSRGGIEFGPLHLDSTTDSNSTSLEVELRSFTVPAGTMGANGAVRIRAIVLTSGAAETKRIRVKFGGELVADVTVPANLTDDQVEIEVVISSVSALTTQRANAFYRSARGLSLTTPVLHTLLVGAVDVSSDVTVSITAQLSGTTASNEAEILFSSAELLAPGS